MQLKGHALTKISGSTGTCQCGEKVSVKLTSNMKLTKEDIADAVMDAHRQHLEETED